jgi:hypothetical protein
VALLVGVVAGGCQGGDVATIGKASASPSAVDQAVAAADKAACLNEAGVGADSGSSGYGPTVWLTTENPYRIWYPNGEFSEYLGEDADQKTQEMLESAWEKMQEAYGGGDNRRPTSAVLFLGEEDYSSQFQRCLNDSGFVPPVVPIDPAQELKQKQAETKAAVAWAQCARDNGHPSVKDPAAPIADEFATFPTVTLPFTITAEQLRTLVEACPAFDAKAIEEYAKSEAKEDPPAPVRVQFDGAPDPSDTKNPDYARLTDYMDILYSEIDAIEARVDNQARD